MTAFASTRVPQRTLPSDLCQLPDRLIEQALFLAGVMAGGDALLSQRSLAAMAWASPMAFGLTDSTVPPGGTPS